MPTRSLPQLLGVLALGILAVSTASILIRFARQEQVPALVIAAYRLGLAALILAPIALRRHRAELRQLTRADWLAALFSGGFLALHFATWISSFDYTTITSSVVLVTTGPIWVALASWLFLRERLSRQIVSGLAVTVLGGFVVGLSDACDATTGVCAGVGLSGTQLWGDFLALAGAWFVAGYLLIGRLLRHRLSLLAYLLVVYGTAAVVLIGLAALNGQSFLISPSGHPFSAQAFLWLILLAVLPQLVGHSSYNYALRFLPPTYVAIVALAEPIGTSILAFLLLAELPPLLTIIGAAVILIGILIASWPDRSN
jgi:drug/metabolite transporter (DMT)-like permease